MGLSRKEIIAPRVLNMWMPDFEGVIRMRCTLMHKRRPVAELELDDVSGFILKIYEVISPEHLPVGVEMRKGSVDRAGLNLWWADRSIPASRSGIKEALEILEIADPRMLLIRCFGLSLSDQYWICPEGSGLIWDRINYFENGFSDDIGDVLFGARRMANVLDFSSPDNTSDGNLKKRWKIIDGRRVLVKGGSNPFRQQPFNEQIASEIMERLDIPHVSYKVVWNNGAPYSICDDFITAETELVPAWRIIQTQKKNNSTSTYQHFVNCSQSLEIPDVVPFLDRMIVLDYIIANEDRHLNNFGALRNAETLEWIGMAPIYDSGSSLGYDKVPAEIRSERNILCKPFKKYHEEQLKLVEDFSWIRFDRLQDVGDRMAQILSVEGAEGYIDQSRIHAIIAATEKRIQRLQECAREQESSSGKRKAAIFSTDNDVTENIAERY